MAPRPGAALAAILLVLILLAPTISAHIQGARPILQRGQFPRTVDLQPVGVAMIADLILSGQSLREPHRNLITHVLDPAQGRFYVEHREDASRAEDRFFAQWRIDRVIEYRDANVNGLYEPNVDTPVKVFRFSNYAWRMSPPQSVQLGEVAGTSVVWEGNLTGSPSIRVEVALAGRPFADEGAIVLAQDVAVYMDLTNLPKRDLGSLYAVEMEATVARDTSLSLFRAENTTTAVLADAPSRRALFVWGGEGFLDGREQVLQTTLTDERTDDRGNRTARVTLHLPTVDRSMRFVLVSGLEYATENQRASPLPSGALLALAVVGAALLAGRRR